jgi:hypothetical protein
MRFARQSLHPDVAAFGEPVDLPSRFEVDAEFRVDNVADHTEFNFGLGTQSESVADFLRNRDLSAISNFHTIEDELRIIPCQSRFGCGRRMPGHDKMAVSLCAARTLPKHSGNA